MSAMKRVHSGFTLTEVLVASTISVFVAMVAVGALKTVTDSARIVNETGETTAELAFAARLLAQDLRNLYRDADPRNMRLVGASQGSDDAPTAFLRFYTVGRAPARIGHPESDVYEVEYILKQIDAPESGLGEEPGGSLLLRRLWPNPDVDRSPGGTLVPIAEGIDVFDLRFFDGQQWVDDWPEELEAIPQLVEVTLATLGAEGSTPTMESFTVSFARMATGSSAADGPGGPGQQGPPQGGNGPGSPAPNAGGPGGSR